MRAALLAVTLFASAASADDAALLERTPAERARVLRPVEARLPGGSPLAAPTTRGVVEVPVLEAGAPGERVRVLAESAVARVILHVPWDALGEVALEGAVLRTSWDPEDRAAGVALEPGTPMRRVEGSDGPVAPQLDDVTAQGLVDEARIGRVFSPRPRPRPATPDASIPSETPILDGPAGAILAVVRADDTGRVPVRRIGPRRRGSALVELAARRATIVGWVPERALRPGWEGGVPVTIAEASLAALPDESSADPAAVPPGTPLYERPGGPIVGTVTQRAGFPVVEARPDGWTLRQVTTPLGTAGVWTWLPPK